MSATLTAVPATAAAPARSDHLALQVALAVLSGVVLALLMTWAVLATFTLEMSI